MNDETNSTPASIPSDLALVLDLDSTLIHTFDDEPKSGSLDFLRDPKYLNIRNRIYHKRIKIYERNKDGTIKDPQDYEMYEFWGVKRPYVQEFLCLCRKCFKYVIIWSAGHYDYVHAIVDELFSKLPFKPDLIYTHLNTIEDDDLGTLKPLSIMIKENPDMELSLKKMIIIDDTNSTFETVNFNNGILIPRYQPKPKPEYIAKEDESLIQVFQKLIFPEVVKCSDIRKVNLRDTFDYSAKDYDRLLDKHDVYYNE